MSVWLERWNEIKFNDENVSKVNNEKRGKLSKETYFALHHTTKTFIEIIKYLLTDIGFKYILLGKFQTDNLERRFGFYRRMSGCNYNVSVTQVLESEKKLKIMNGLRVKSST